MQTEIISFHSDVDGTTYYSDCAKNLTRQLKALEIPHDIRAKESLGSYQKNCLSKPLYILSALEEKKRPVLWLDVDSSVLATLDVFDAFEGSADLVLARTSGEIASSKASPIYFAYNERALTFLRLWIAGAEMLTQEGKWFDHEALLHLLKIVERSPRYRIEFVGPEYCAWPGKQDESTVIIMGLSDAESKKSKLREMGMNEEQILWQSPGVK